MCISKISTVYRMFMCIDIIIPVGSSRQELLSLALVNSAYTSKFLNKLEAKFVKRFVKCDLLNKIC